MNNESLFDAAKRKVRSATLGHVGLRYASLALFNVARAGFARYSNLTISGSHKDFDANAAVNYATSVFQNFHTYASKDRFHGRVAEIGPGDSSAFGLLCLADGCEQVDLVDRYYSARDNVLQREVNRAVVERHPTLRAHLLDEQFSDSSFAGLTRRYGPEAAAEVYFEQNRDYDFILSCAVFEHLYDPLKALRSTALALKPGGMMLHQVDCRDHGIFSQRFHELKFLELSEPLFWPLRVGGNPNRVRVGEYIKTLDALPVQYEIFVSELAGTKHSIPLGTKLGSLPKPAVDESRAYVESIRGRLAEPFRSMQDRDLMVSGFCLVATRN